MKTLERHFRWALGEKPTAQLFWQKLTQLCTRIEVAATVNAAANLVERGRGADYDRSVDDFAWCFEHQPQAFADYALALCRATEVMHEAVLPAAVEFKYSRVVGGLLSRETLARIDEVCARPSAFLQRLQDAQEVRRLTEPALPITAWYRAGPDGALTPAD